jgi:hypothetical protein
MSKEYIQELSSKPRHEVKLVDSALDAPVKLEVRANADEGPLGGPTLALRGHALYALDVGQTMTIIIED